MHTLSETTDLLCGLMQAHGTRKALQLHKTSTASKRATAHQSRQSGGNAGQSIIIHNSGSSWSTVYSAQEDTLRDVVFINSTSYAVGEGGLLLEYSTVWNRTFAFPTAYEGVSTNGVSCTLDNDACSEINSFPSQRQLQFMPCTSTAQRHALFCRIRTNLNMQLRLQDTSSHRKLRQRNILRKQQRISLATDLQHHRAGNCATRLLQPNIATILRIQFPNIP